MAQINATSAAEVQQAIAAGGTLEVLGSGSKRGIGPAVTASRVLSLADLSGVNFFEPAELTLSVKAGTSLTQITTALEQANHRLAFEPPSYQKLLGPHNGPTAGGLVATNASGPGRLARGALRDHLLGFEGVNGRGELVKSGGRVMKNVSGLDLCKALAGSWGTLAVMTDVVFKTLPRAELERTLLVSAANATDATDVMTRGLCSPFDLTAAAYLPAKAGVALRLEGIEASVTYRTTELKDLLASGRDVQLIDQADSAALWEGVREVQPALGEQSGEVWRLSVAPQSGARLLDLAAERLGARGFLDWGGGLVWLSLPAGSSVANPVELLNGTRGHVLGFVSGARAFTSQSASTAQLAAGIKRAFDPKGLLNPQRLYRGF